MKQDIGIRSLHFRNNVLSVGTGVGTVLFYDVRANKFLNADECESSSLESSSSMLNRNNYLKLETNRGWIVSLQIYIYYRKTLYILAHGL